MHRELEFEYLLQESNDDGADEFEFESGDSLDQESESEFEADSTDSDTEWGHPVDPEFEQVAEREQLAYELLGVESESEVDEFLGKLGRFAKKAVKGIARRALPQVSSLLKGPAGALLRRALPMVGGAAGSVVPGLGTALGGYAGQGLSQLLGGEMEFATEEEAKLDLSRRLVDTVTGALGAAAQDPRAASDPTQAVKGAMVEAMRSNLPTGVRRALSGGKGHATRGASAGGRWVRRGNTIVIIGA